MPDPDHPEAPPNFDCDSCQHGKAEIGLNPRSFEQRRYMHCGYYDEREWLDSSPGDGKLAVPRQFGGDTDVPGTTWQEEDPETGATFPNVCPGWAVRHPVVTEICRAYRAFDKGALESLFPEISNVVATGLMEVSRAFDEYGRQQLVALNRRSERNG